MALYRKGQVAEIAQINPETLRFYEKNKLIPEPERTASGYRLYPEAVFLRLDFIKNAKASGFSLKQIHEFFQLVENQEVGLEEMLPNIDQKINELDSRIKSLEEMRNSLIEFRNRGSESVECPYIRAYLNNFRE